MFRLTLILRKNADGDLMLTLPTGFRLLFAVIVVFLVASMISTGNLSAGSVVLSVLSLFAGLYKEQWRFSKDTRLIVHQSGLLYPYITKSVSFDSIETFVLSYGASWRGAMRRRGKQDFDDTLQNQRRGSTMTSFGFVTVEGRAQTIEIRKSRAHEQMEEEVQQIADYCGIPVKIQE